MAQSQSPRGSRDVNTVERDEYADADPDACLLAVLFAECNTLRDENHRLRREVRRQLRRSN
jgi:hypothetical protein